MQKRAETKGNSRSVNVHRETESHFQFVARGTSTTRDELLAFLVGTLQWLSFDPQPASRGPNSPAL
jgi:hypothetical protein